MTQAEFEVEARRVLVALDVEANLPLEISYVEEIRDPEGRPRLHGPLNIFQLDFAEEGAYIILQRKNDQIHTTLLLCIANREEHWSWAFIDDGATPEMYIQVFNLWKIPAHYVSLGARALFRLGYDIQSLYAQSELTLTAHEKAQWYVEDKDRFSIKQEGDAS